MVYLGLGGNIGDSKAVLRQALARIAALPEIKELEVSSFYKTSPVSEIPQSDYLNAVCRFKTGLSAGRLFEALKAIEKSLGKEPKSKNVPRVIDIDLLFFGTESYQEEGLEIPHPRWRERLFVIVPLLDLTATIIVPGKDYHEEIVDLIKLRDSIPDKEFQRVELREE